MCFIIFFDLRITILVNNKCKEALIHDFFQIEIIIDKNL
jgi:hypothetical protein